MRKKVKITREQYKSFKRMNHRDTENFIANLYDEAYKEGKKETQKGKVRCSDIAAAIMEVPGIETKIASDIIATVNKLFEG